MNRKGDVTLKEATQFLLAIIVILLLAFFSYKIYNYVTADDERESAIALLDSLENRINSLKDSESQTVTLQGFKGGEQWAFIAWSFGDVGDKPDFCTFSSCLCACKLNDVPSGGYLVKVLFKDVPETVRLRKGDHSVSCEENGLCRKIDFDEIVLEGRVWPSFTGEVELYTSSQFSERLFEIPMKRSGSNIEIIQNSKEYEEDVAKNPDLSGRWFIIK